MVTTSRVESALGCWTVTDFTPRQSDPLAAVVQRVWLFNGVTALPRERTFPDGALEIILQLDADYRPVADRPAEPFPALSVGGMRTTAMTIESSGRPVRVLGVKLHPLGAYTLLRTSLATLTDRDPDLNDVIGRSASELAERCAAAPSDARCVLAALGWLRSRTGGAPEPPVLVARAVAQIESGAGDLLIAALDAGGRKTSGRFAAAFGDYVGVTPKRFARIVRFRRCLELLKSSRAPLGTVALNSGYYDQPHMNAEFKSHAGMTPQTFRRALHYPNGTSVAEQIFQDALASPA
jgi:hypothetical protein